jgi:sortase A
MIEDLMRDINEAEMMSGTEDITSVLDIEIDDAGVENGGLYDDNGDYNGLDDEAIEHESATEQEAELLTVAVYEPVFTDPVPDNAFPANITGIGILTIDSIDLRLPIAEGIEYASLRIAPGRVPQTAQVGDIGNAVIAGHRNYAFGSMFNRFGEIEIGDIVRYQARNGELMEFEVFEIAVIEPEDQIAFLQPLSESIITLYTCTPIRTATHRLIIRAHRV